MRILHLLASPFFSGPAETVVALASAQRALGHEVAIAVDRKRSLTAAEELLVPRLAGAGLLDEGGLVLSVKSSPFELWRDLRRLHGRAADVVHAHFTHDHFLARLARPRGAVLVRSIHAARSIRASLPAADAFTAPTELLASRLPPRPRRILPALVGPEFQPARDRQALRAELDLPGEPVVGMVSTFQPSRRHELGLRAFALVRAEAPSARLVLVGDGALEPELRKLAPALGLGGAVTFAGYRSGPEFIRWLQALDEVWVLGLGNDFAGRAAAQARACGVRVVAVDEGALASWADEVVREPTPEAVAAAWRSGARREVALPEPASVAREILALYGEARPR